MRLFSLLLLTTFPPQLHAEVQADIQPTAIELAHVTVIDSTGAPAKSDRTVLIRGGRIASIGPTKATPAQVGTQVIDARGKFLIPGLWDMHVHWYLKEYLPLFIANGVTGVRQMNGRPSLLEWRREVASGGTLGPRLSVASPIVDGPKPVQPNSIKIANANEARQSVTTIKREGYDFIKVYNLVPREAYFALASEAKAQGLSFVGHTPFAVTAGEASDAGQKSIEHLAGVLLSCSREEQALTRTLLSDPAVADQPKMGDTLRARLVSEIGASETYDSVKARSLLGRFIRNGTWQDPTLVILRDTELLDEVHDLKDERLRYLPPAVRERFDPTNNQMTKTILTLDHEKRRNLFRWQIEMVGEMRRAGVLILAGTDTSEFGGFPGFSLHDELELLVRAGLTPMEALQSATISAARFLGEEREFGSVEEGKVADLVLLDANPLADISNIKRIDAVIFGGKLISKPELERLLARVEDVASGHGGPK